MSTVQKISIAVTPDMLSLLHSAVDNGEYASTSEIIREALRAWTLKRKIETLEIEELRRLVQEGIESGPAEDAQAVFSRLKAKYSVPSKDNDS
jgi:antitoxin ParD1/3/4